MAYGNSRKNSYAGRGNFKGKGKKKGNYRKVGSVYQDKDNEDKAFIAVDNYHGNLYFEDNKSGNMYKVNFISMLEPKSFNGKKLPKTLLSNLTINLDSETSVELIEE